MSSVSVRSRLPSRSTSTPRVSTRSEIRKLPEVCPLGIGLMGTGCPARTGRSCPQTTQGMTAGERAGALVFWSGMYALAALGMFVAYWGRLKMLSYVGSHVAGDLRDKVYRHLHSLSMRYFG